MNNNRLEKIHRGLHREAYLWARQCCSYDDDKAKDVLQMVYLKILEGRAKYNEKGKVRTWLFSVIRYTAIDLIRKDKRHATLEEVSEPALQEEKSNGNDYEKLLNKLPYRQHQVLLLVFYHNLTLEQVADVLDIGLGTVRTHYDRGKNTLRKIIKNTSDYEGW